MILYLFLDVTIMTSKAAGLSAGEHHKVTRRTKDKDTPHSNAITSSNNSHDTTSHINTPQRPLITDSAFPSETPS